MVISNTSATVQTYTSASYSPDIGDWTYSIQDNPVCRRSLRNKKIAVTGGSGFIGKHLIKALEKEEPYLVRNFDIKDGCDLTKICKMSNSLDGYDVVFHLATLPLPLSLTNPYLVANEIYSMALTLCELCRQEVFETLISVSSSEVYEPNTPYAAAKDSQDKLVQAYVKSFGIDANIVRPFNAYGPGQPILAVIPMTIYRILKKKRPIISGDGNQSRDFTYVEDITLGIKDAYKTQENRDISSGECFTIEETVKLISDLMGYKGKPIYKDKRQGDTEVIHSSEGLRDYTRFERGLKKTIKWYSSHI